ncbi:CYIR protein [Plasmodium cynomolgi strain B]|uniref:CYIR protein n=1 Tax=Plasmodium cynomolgi (strain B) TaxID=1120755 RepID=K6VJI2_PLACD|nr:CYIR protein [Plasmodium cynomolgi strain B]GAB69562.1 CYIR protein [Plasmodium cynomolgi strain B]
MFCKNCTKKRKMTFYYLKCTNEDNEGYRRCALIPTTMEYTENEDESKISDELEEKEITVPPDPTIVLGGILKKREQTTDREVVRGTSESTDNPFIDSSDSRSVQTNSEYLTEADGISPYLVQTEKGIKWKILDNATYNCKTYKSKDTYGLCNRLAELHQEGKIKFNPNSSGRNVRNREPSLEREGLSDTGSYETNEDDAYSPNTWNDMYSLLRTWQFRTGTTIVLMLGIFSLYTPIGSFFMSRKGERRNIDHEYFERKSEELSGRSQNSVSKNRNNDRIQIVYQQG